MCVFTYNRASGIQHKLDNDAPVDKNLVKNLISVMSSSLKMSISNKDV